MGHKNDLHAVTMEPVYYFMVTLGPNYQWLLYNNIIEKWLL